MAVKDRDRFSTATRLRLLGEQTAARVYRSQTKRQARRSRLTGRAALLALVLCTLVVALAYPMRQYVSQRAEIADQQRETRRRPRERVEQLRDQKARWQDDAYAEQQIRAAAALRACRARPATSWSTRTRPSSRAPTAGAARPPLVRERLGRRRQGRPPRR